MTPLNKVKDAIQELKCKQDELEIIEAEMEEALTEVLSPEQIEQINNIKIEYGFHIDCQKKAVNQAQDEVKRAVLEHGSSVKHAGLHAVWKKGRVKWNTKGLDGYAVAHPEILGFRSEGNPSVSIREVK